MNRMGYIFTLAITLAITSLSMAAVEAQQRPYRMSDQQMNNLMVRTKNDIGAFRSNLDLASDRNRSTGNRSDGNIHQLLSDLGQAVDRLGDQIDSNRSSSADVEEVLRRASSIDVFIARNRLEAPVERDWQNLQRDLDELARAYNVTWRRTGSQNGRSRVGSRLTGTYQLDTGRGDQPRVVAEQATRRLPANQRQRIYENLLTRLDAPEVISIDRNGGSVSIASSRGERLTFEADGRIRTERLSAGRTVNTRARINGERLVVTTTGNRGNDFSVTFEPIDNGRTLQVTRRISTEGLRQPVAAQSFYRKSSDTAQWDVYSSSPEDAYDTGSGAGDFVVPNGTRLVATLDNALSTRTSRDGDRFSMTVQSPAQYQGAIIEGSVRGVNPSGRVRGRAEMSLDFESIRRNNGRTDRFAGFIETLRTPNGETIRVDNEGTVAEADSQGGETVQRGAIGAALGALIGAIAGGGQGAAIGAAVGAGAGVSTVIVQGRDQLDLQRGTELTISSSAPR